MTQFYYYHSAFDSITQFNVSLGTDVVRLGTEQGFEEVAEHLASGSTEVTFDDPDGNLGTGGDAIRGIMRFFLDETAMASNNRRVFVGIFGSRSYRRRAGANESLRLGVAREIRAELQDVNALASLRVIPQSDTAANRPAETVSARLSWILGSVYLSTVYDDGLVVANTKVMDKSDYRGQRPANAINDCEMTAGFGWNAFIYWNEANNRAALFFDNANTSTAYTSTLRISNVLADLDTLSAAQFTTGTTFGPSIDAELRRDPADLGTGVYLPYLNGAVYRTRAATIDDYGRKDIIAPNSNVSSAARATALADDFLWQHHTEEDRITCTLELPTNKVNLIRAGHRIQVKFQHLPGYEAWTWMRVVKRTAAQSKPTDDRYIVHLELSPQEGAEPATGLVQMAVGRGEQSGLTLALPNAVTIGNTLVCVIATKLDSNPGPPNTSFAPEWGTSAWTRFNGANLTTYQSYSGVTAWWKTADTTDQSGYISEQNPAVAIFEIAGADPASATIVDQDQIPAGPNYDIGTQTPAVGDIAIAAWVMGPVVGDGEFAWDYSNSYPWQTPTPDPGISTGWTLDYSRWVSDNYSREAFLPHSPWTVFAHALGTGAALLARCTIGATKQMGGIYLVIPPL